MNIFDNIAKNVRKATVPAVESLTETEINGMALSATTSEDYDTLGSAMEALGVETVYKEETVDKDDLSPEELRQLYNSGMEDEDPDDYEDEDTIEMLTDGYIDEAYADEASDAIDELTEEDLEDIEDDEGMESYLSAEDFEDIAEESVSARSLLNEIKSRSRENDKLRSEAAALEKEISHLKEKIRSIRKTIADLPDDTDDTTVDSYIDQITKISNQCKNIRIEIEKKNKRRTEIDEEVKVLNKKIEELPDDEGMESYLSAEQLTEYEVVEEDFDLALEAATIEKQLYKDAKTELKTLTSQQADLKKSIALKRQLIKDFKKKPRKERDVYELSKITDEISHLISIQAQVNNRLSEVRASLHTNKAAINQQKKDARAEKAEIKAAKRESLDAARLAAERDAEQQAYIAQLEASRLEAVDAAAQTQQMLDDARAQIEDMANYIKIPKIQLPSGFKDSLIAARNAFVDTRKQYKKMATESLAWAFEDLEEAECP